MTIVSPGRIFSRAVSEMTWSAKSTLASRYESMALIRYSRCYPLVSGCSAVSVTRLRARTSASLLPPSSPILLISLLSHLRGRQPSLSTEAVMVMARSDSVTH